MSNSVLESVHQAGASSMSIMKGLICLLLMLVAGCSSAPQGEKKRELELCQKYITDASKGFGQYVPYGIEAGLACLKQGHITEKEVEILVNNRIEGIEVYNTDALSDLSVYIDTYVTQNVPEFEALIGQKLLRSAITNKIASKGRYEFFLAVSLTNADCTSNHDDILSLLWQSADQEYILSLAFLMHIYQTGYSCFSKDAGLFLLYKNRFDVVDRPPQIDYEDVIEYLMNKNILSQGG